MSQFLKKQKEAHKVQWAVLWGWVLEVISQVLGLNLGFDSHCILLRSIARVQRQGLEKKKLLCAQNLWNIQKLTSWQEQEEDPMRIHKKIVTNARVRPAVWVAEQKQAALPSVNQNMHQMHVGWGVSDSVCAEEAQIFPARGDGWSHWRF